MSKAVTNVLILAFILSSGTLFLDSLTNGEPFFIIHIPEGMKLFLSAVLNPPSFNEWQLMNSITDMIVTGVAFLFRVVAIWSFYIATLFIFFIIATLIVQELKSAWTCRKGS